MASLVHRILPCLPGGQSSKAEPSPSDAKTERAKNTIAWGPKSQNQVVKVLVEILCRLVVDDHDQTLKRDFDIVYEQARQAINDDQVVEAIVLMTRKIRAGQMLDRYNGRKRPDVMIYNAWHGTESHAKQEHQDAVDLKEQVLIPLVGPSADNIWKMCTAAGWSQQNLYDWLASKGGYVTGAAVGYAEAAEKDRLWSEYYARRLGFDALPPKLSRDLSVVALCDSTCRLWTMEYDKGKQIYKFEGASRLAKFEISVLEGRECLPSGLTELVVTLAAQQRRKVFEIRNGPLVNLAGRAEPNSEAMEAQDLDRSGASGTTAATLAQLRRVLGSNAGQSVEAIQKVCDAAAWHEQSLVEADSMGSFDDRRARETRARAQLCAEQKAAARLQLGLDALSDELRLKLKDEK